MRVIQGSASFARIRDRWLVSTTVSLSYAPNKVRWYLEARGGVERGRSVGESGSRIASTDLSSEFLLFSKGVRLGEGEGEVRLGEEGELEGGGAWEVRFFSWKGIFRDEGGMRGGWRGWEGGVEVRVKVRRGVESLR